MDDIGAARLVVASLPVIVAPSAVRRTEAAVRRAAGRSHSGAGRSLTEGEASVCRQLGLSEEAFLNTAGI